MEYWWAVHTLPHPFAMFAMTGAGLTLAAAILSLFLQYIILLYKYRTCEPNLIKPSIFSCELACFWNWSAFMIRKTDVLTAQGFQQLQPDFW